MEVKTKIHSYFISEVLRALYLSYSSYSCVSSGLFSIRLYVLTTLTTSPSHSFMQLLSPTETKATQSSWVGSRLRPGKTLNYIFF